MKVKNFESNVYQRKTYKNNHASRKRNTFNDPRLVSVMEDLSSRMSTTGKISIQQNAEKDSDSKRFYRFLNNDRVEVQELIELTCTVKPEVLIDKEILIVGDTVSWNMKKTRIKDSEELGVLNDGKTPGFRSHVHLALNPSGEVLALADVIHWIRPKQAEAQQKEAHKKKTWEEKESIRWALGASNASEATKLASRRTFIYDQEADEFNLIKHIAQALGDDIIIRANHNRIVRYGDTIQTVDECLSNSKPLGKYEVDLPKLDHYSWTSGSQVKRKARIATIQLKTTQVELLQPKKKGNETISLYLVEARETGHNLGENEAPILWRLWTTHEVLTYEQAKQIVYYYTLRWVIEQFFRLLKKKGFRIESTELGTYKAVLKQTTIAMKVATTVKQLVYARDRMDCQPTDDVFDEKEQQILQKLNERLEGKTEKQKNPFPQEKLSWASWIIGRLGGWKGYTSQGSPGPITMKTGLDKFYTYVEAFDLLNSE
jgi:Transposase DDE domain